MEFDLTDDERGLRDEARRFLEREAPIAYARAMMDEPSRFRADAWRRIADLGWLGLPFPEEHGGVGLSFVSLSLLVAEMGRVVLPGPYLPTVLAGLAVLDAGSDEQRKEILPPLCAGETIWSLAVDPEDEEPDGCTVHAVPDGDHWRLDGEKRFVLDAANAERFVVAAQAPDGPALFVASREGATIVALDVMDRTRSAASMTFDGAAAQRMPAPSPAIGRAIDRAAVALAAEMLGAAERSLELAVDYAQQRQQFGRPIGSFQAVKHRAASMHVDVESARNTVWFASWALERGRADAPLAASTAKAVASDAATRVVAGAIQIHGGIGFTWEHDAHLFFKRVKLAAAVMGDSTWHRDRAAMLLAARY